MRIMKNGPSERLDGVLNVGQLCMNDGQSTLSTARG